MEGGIIAAGHGSRLKKGGMVVPKPLLKINGTELIGRTVSEFKKAGIYNIRVIFRKRICEQCSEYLATAFPECRFRILCKDTESSAESFLTLLEGANGSDRLLLTTVDSIFAPGALDSFVEKALKMPKDHVILGVTRYVDDEKPLFVSFGDKADNKITAIGGTDGDAVTCGVYLMPQNIWTQRQEVAFPALRAFLSHLFHKGIGFCGVDMGKVIDVDRPEDIKEAEKFLNMAEKGTSAKDSNRTP